MGNNNFSLMEYGILVLMVVILVFVIYLASGGNLDVLLSKLV
ncbi:hypothetical protein [Orenia metallireducens]|jgi:hypothetical protein|nr:hypothetical protein [Orenia metallireducens]